MKNSFNVMSIILILGALLISCNQKNNSNTSSIEAGYVIKDPPYDIEMVYMPAGTLKWEADYERHEMLVYLKSFCIGKYEMTQAQWKAVMGYNPSEIVGDDYSVTNVSWDTVLVIMKKLSEETGHAYDVPPIKIPALE